MDIARGIKNTVGLLTYFKWPNDLLISEKKVAGILVESALNELGPKYALLGIGINVNKHPGGILPGGIEATSLAYEAGRVISREELLGSILTEFDLLYNNS